MAITTVAAQALNGEPVFYDGGDNKLFFVADGTGVSANWLASVGIINHRLYHRFFTDFHHYSDDAWILTVISAGAGDDTIMTCEDANMGIEGTGGIIKLDSAGNDNDGPQIQLQGESFKLATGKPLYFGARVRFTEATQNDLAVGLCITDTTLITAMTDGVYFMSADAAATVTFNTELNSVPTSNIEIAALTADTWYVLEFIFDGAGTITPYIDGVPGTAVTTNLPTDENLTVSFAWLNGDATQHDGMFVDWVDVVQLR